MPLQITLTDEDIQIAVRGGAVSRLMHPGDDIDYRVMMAREVYKEREWRIHDRAVTPVDVQALDNLNAWRPDRFMALREYVERINGEPL